MIHPAYWSLINKIKKSPYWIEIDPDFSAIELVHNAELVISLPFTSTALLGKECGKPSIYYDPHGLLQKNDPAAHGIQIICGLQELRSWFNSVQETLVS
jgi:polysaccharide biosynthesis PFTS motif protein